MVEREGRSSESRGCGQKEVGEERTEDTLGRTSLLAALSLEGPEELGGTSESLLWVTPGDNPHSSNQCILAKE